MTFSVLSLNTWQERGPWEMRWEVIFGEIQRLKPDILAFQEVFKPEWAAEVLRRTGKKELAVFPDHSSGLILLSDFPMERKAILRYEARSPNEAYYRYAIFAEIRTASGPVHFFNTHLSWQPADREIRRAQMGELVRWIAAQGEAPAVVTGDFNSDAGSPELEVMTGAGFVDAFSYCRPGAEKMTWSHRNPFTHSDFNKLHGDLLPERRIDFIFFRGPSLSAADMDTVYGEPSAEGVWASDHIGLFGRFRREGSS